METNQIEIVVNGAKKIVPQNIFLDRLLTFLEVDPSRVAIERNREIVRRAAWPATEVQPGDQFEVVWFVGGG